MLPNYQTRRKEPEDVQYLKQRTQQWKGKVSIEEVTIHGGKRSST